MPRTPHCITQLGIGVFDGIHKGHQVITRHCDHIMTFFPHPRSVLHANHVVKRLTSLSEMAVLHPGVIPIKFTPALAKQSPEAFFNNVILPLAPHTIHVGSDFRFGHQRQGSTALLHDLAQVHNISVCVHDLQHSDNQPIKSERIRRVISAGLISEAINLLGHSYLLSGTVIRGDQRGRKLGFPTANMRLDSDKLSLPPGVYAGTIKLDKSLFLALIYSGGAPTFLRDSLSIEVHIINYTGNLYDKIITVFVDRFIRHEIQFRSASDLKHQINQDIESVLVAVDSLKEPS